MKSVQNFFKNAINFIAGLNFYGIGLLLLAVLFFFLGVNFVAWGLIGAFIHKNLDAIISHLTGKEEVAE